MCCVAGNTWLGPCCHLGITPEPHLSWCPGVTTPAVPGILVGNTGKGCDGRGSPGAAENNRSWAKTAATFLQGRMEGMILLTWTTWTYSRFCFQSRTRWEQVSAGRRRMKMMEAVCTHGSWAVAWRLRCVSPAWASLPFRVNCSPCTLSFTAGFLQIFRKMWGEGVGLIFCIHPKVKMMRRERCN